MKVLQIITKGEVGGAQSHVLTLCRELACQGVAVQVAIGGAEPHPPLANALEASHLAVHRVPALGNALNPVHVVRAAWALRGIVLEQSPDLLHAHSAMAGVVARLAGALTRTPVIYTVHGFAFKAGHPWKRRTVALAMEWLLAPLTRRMICVSDHERRLALVLPLPSRRVSVIHNGVEDVAVPGNSAASTAEAAPTIAMVARMAPPKRPDILLHALAQLRGALGHEVPATFFGGGPELAAHRALAHRLGLQAVRFTGDVDDVAAQLAQHAIFVLASDHEGLPISLIEAMRAGMAIVASDLPGIRELLPESAHARLVAPDPAAWATALRQLIESPALRARMGAAARQRYEQHYTAKRMALAVRSVYAAATSRTH
ncbi:glycosyltransferase [Acidovorax sp. SUPP3434]|uniref:glycosyltransferase family 4 protein n=1 Tax=Acidovorax sp. SUPP3434 TaxID=2920880 RepID=UPI0023DE695E|nr:glycosyltransferase family 4 protein [Acidovorax sp. SUPP3434]GKT01431.1 glycosyltransferase [Acidovorax sp. SUPP3434]